MRLESVAFRYRRKDPWVFRDVTLSLARGSVSEVTGHNGAGKSTLLRVMAGLRRPGAGEVKDRPARVGYAPERFPVDQPFSVRAYLGHMAAMRHIPTDVVGVWSERLRFAHLLDVRLPELSKGSAQKIGLAQAFMADPELLILDEPFAGLDAATRDALPALISELAANGTTVVVSDHQRCIEAMPGIHRLHVADHTVTRLPPPNDTTDARPRPENNARTHPAPNNDARTGNTETSPAPGDDDTTHPEPSDNGGAGLELGDNTETRPAPEDGSRTRTAAGRGALAPVVPGGGSGLAVLEVEVPEGEADTVESKLRADGYRVRRREG
ncbi:ABC transporter ATP-binding protein [Spirillospora sp. CA-128828]|uniref:ABC transporter ATP-binding protein n=1 Tax=Spirillospora sp. CA-128828 TaxID=3240033 RepID=UPI003D949CDB